MKVPEAIINSIDQHTMNVSNTFESMLKETQTAIAEIAYKRGYEDGVWDVKMKSATDECITEDLKALCARREVPLTQVADVMQKMFDEGETE